MEPITTGKKKSKIYVFLRVVFSILIILAGFTGMELLSKMKSPLEKKVVKEVPIRVESVISQIENVPVFITGYGKVAVLNSVAISSEVSGKIMRIHPRLEAGEFIKKGETLFEIDKTEYNIEYETNRKRLKTQKRNTILAKKEYLRSKALYKNSNTGTLSEVESYEQTYNSEKDTADQLEKTLKTNALNLERCIVVAPFDARIKEVSLEKGQYVAIGSTLVTLADDSVLEILVPVDSNEAFKTLEFKGSKTGTNVSWFRQLKHTKSEITWTGNRSVKSDGVLHRVVKFNSDTRTLHLAVRIVAKDQKKTDFPIVEGMFCQVKIPGKVISNVIKIPRDAVSFENTVYVSTNNRLKTVPVEVEKTDDHFSLVSSGLKEGDIVITTKMVAPLENSLLELSKENLIAKK